MCFFVDLILFLGRILFAFVFAYLGIDQLLHWSRSIDALKDMPANTASLVLVVGLILQFFGAFSLFFGVKTRIGALALLIYVLAVAIQPVSFATLTQAGHESELLIFLQQILTIAGLLYVLGVGSGRLSCDWLCGNSRCTTCPVPKKDKELPPPPKEEPKKP